MHLLKFSSYGSVLRGVQLREGLSRTHIFQTFTFIRQDMFIQNKVMTTKSPYNYILIDMTVLLEPQEADKNKNRKYRTCKNFESEICGESKRRQVSSEAMLRKPNSNESNQRMETRYLNRETLL